VSAAAPRRGTVYLVGAGPGAPDLLTLRAARLLERADVVFHDALVHADTLALARRARIVCVGKRSGRVSTDQRFIDRALVEAARTHEVVVRLKGGDPSLFARAAEELDALEAAGIACEIVPGVTAALAAAAEWKQPLTRRGVARNVSFATLRTGRGEAPHRAGARADTLMLYMAGDDARATRDALLAQGFAPSTPVVVGENLSLPGARARRTTLGALADVPPRSGDAPVLLGVGEVFAPRQNAAGIEALPSARRA
jgi:uroporphyrin-III C-methyltransferase